MYPKTYLDNFWRGDLRREVFVIMPFDSSLDSVWTEAIGPAIRELEDDHGHFEPVCVRENTPNADIIREIIDGITNSTLVFADISLLRWQDDQAQRNSNVMYELGIANAYREEADIIVVKSDSKSAEFDIAPNRYHQYDRDDLPSAKLRFVELLRSGLETRVGIKRAIAESTWASLDIDSLNFMHSRPASRPFLHPRERGEVAALRRLLGLGLVNVEYVEERNGRHLTWYQYTPFGRAVIASPRFATPADIEQYGRQAFSRRPVAG